MWHVYVLRCFLKPEEQIYDRQVGSVPGKRIDCCCGEAECRGRLLWDIWTWKIVRQTEISPHIMIRKKTIRLLEFDLHSKRYFLWNISVRPWTGLETCQTWCNICLVPRRMFEALFCLWSLWTIIQSSHMIPISLVHWKMNIQQFHIYITKLNVSTEEI